MCPTLCNRIDGSPPGSALPGILQARTLEWVAISFSIVWKWKVKMKSLSLVQLLVSPWTAAYQAPLSMGFSRPEHWSGVPLPSPENEYRKVNSDLSHHTFCPFLSLIMYLFVIYRNSMFLRLLMLLLSFILQFFSFCYLSWFICGVWYCIQLNFILLFN